MFRWDAGNGVASDLSAALQRCWDRLSTPTVPVPFQTNDHEHLMQTHLSSMLGKASLGAWCSRAGSDDQCRFQAFAVDGAATVLGPTPSYTLDTTLSSSDFLALIGCRLGVDVCGGGPCRFCGKPADCKGRHALSCMAAWWWPCCFPQRDSGPSLRLLQRGPGWVMSTVLLAGDPADTRR